MPLLSLNLPAPPGFEFRSGSFDDPTTPMTAVAVWNEIDGGPSASGESVSERTAMAISTVYTCVTTLSEAIASLPCKLYLELDNGKELATEHFLYSLLAFAPNEEMAAFTFWSTMVGCSALTGNAYAEITRDPDGAPNGMWPLHPLKTKPVRKKDGTLEFRTTDGSAAGSYRTIAARNVLHFPLFSLDGIMGVGPVTAARESFELAKAAEKFGARWFGNGAHVPSILVNKGPKPDPKVQQELKESWQSAHGGSNANKQAFLFGEWERLTTGMSPEDSQFLGARAYSRSDIAAMFHLQPHQAGDTSRLSNANHTQSQLSFVTDCLRPILCRIEAELKKKLLGIRNNLFVEFDLSERLRGDTVAQNQAYTLGRQGGYLSVNEIRKDMGLNPIGAEGDVYLYATNQANAEQLLKDVDLIPITQESAPTGEPLIDPTPKPAPNRMKKTS